MLLRLIKGASYRNNGQLLENVDRTHQVLA